MDRHQTTAKLREIEARVAGASSASDVVEAVMKRLAHARASEKDVAVKLEIPDVVLADLFFLLCDRYGVEGGLASKRSQRTLTLTAPRSFIDTTFVPIFRQSATVLFEYIVREAHALIQEAYGMTSAGPSVMLRPPSK